MASLSTLFNQPPAFSFNVATLRPDPHLSSNCLNQNDPKMLSRLSLSAASRHLQQQTARCLSVSARRDLNLLEYQAKGLLQKHDVCQVEYRTYKVGTACILSVWLNPDEGITG